jgi:hypothetical protein
VRTAVVVALLLTCLAARAWGAEGMFLLDRLPVAALKKSGLKISAAKLLQLSRAVVQVASGGTGSFVSRRGLVATNHHVAYRCLAALGSRREHLGLLERGYLARTEAAELPCPGYDLLVVQEVRDVTSQVRTVALSGRWPAQVEAIRLRREDLVAECEKEHASRTCEISALNGGTGYLLSVYRRIRDVRLVYAPPLALGKYGGEIDNWMFPRHTADFTFLRAYVDRRGSTAAYAKDNVPLGTPQHLEVTGDGIRERSLVEVIGFPARTSRHVPARQARFYIQEQIPVTLGLLKGLINTVNHLRSSSDDVSRKYASLESGLQNALKYYEMSREGFTRWKTLERKQEQETALLARQEKDEPAATTATATLAEIDKVLDRAHGYYRRFALLARLVGASCASLRAAHDMAKWGHEKAKESRLRKDERFKDKNVYRVIEAAERLEQEIDLDAEKALLLHMLREGQKLPVAQRPKSTAALLRWGRAELARARAAAARQRRPLAELYQARYGVAPAPDPLQAAVDMMYGGTRLIAHGDDPTAVAEAVKLRSEVFAMKSAEVAKLGDPLLRYGRDVEAELTALREGPYKELEQYLETVLRPRWVQAVKPAYPDADFTVRLSFGSVRSYTAAASGRSYRHLTTLSELLAKDKGTLPFLVPRALRAAFPRRMSSPLVDRAVNDIPVNFTATLDTTGGNSGSPVLDDRGRLVGLLFDGTPESILSDWQFVPSHQRAICLDIRFVLYLASLEKAERLLKELRAPAR